MQKINYQKKMETLISTFDDKIPTLMLHSCCAPCSTYVIEYLSNYFEITVFYYNPNIYPEKEYIFRCDEQQRYIKSISTKNKVHFLKGDYESDLFYEMSKGLEAEKECGKRCLKCYDLRLRKTAIKALEKQHDYFATTLTISPLKNAQVINEVGLSIEKDVNVLYLCSDFKKNNGYKRSVELSNQYNIYRQNYCGCVFSQQL